MKLPKVWNAPLDIVIAKDRTSFHSEYIGAVVEDGEPIRNQASNTTNRCCMAKKRIGKK